MCRYVINDYRDTYVCLDCRISFKGPRERHATGGSTRCGRCGKDGHNIGKDYRVPRRTAINEWRKLRLLIESGRNFRTCGCGGAGPFPRTFADAKRELGAR